MTTPQPPMRITNGRVIDPASGTDRTADVLIRDGRISAIDTVSDTPPDGRLIDAAGMLVVPGLIDPHVHLREPGQEHKETIASGTRAAAAGGFTTVCCMPNTTPALDTPERIAWVHGRADGEPARVFAVGAATVDRQGEELVDFRGGADAGAVAFSDDGDGVADEDVMRRVFESCREVDRVFMQHCQDPAMTVGSVMNEGAVSRRLGMTGWPREAETTMIERDIRLVRETGARYHVQHLSCAGSVDLIRAARAEGLPVSAEASPHHLLLTDEACESFDTNAKMNPPLREQSDVDAVRAGVADGTITVLATDHAPHTFDEKNVPFEQAPFGIIGLEFALPLYAEALVHSGLIDWPRLIALMTIEPARICGLDAIGLGSLTEGGPADVTIIDPDTNWTLTEAQLAGKCRNTPFLGHRMRGRAVITVRAGQLALDHRAGQSQA